MGRGKPKIFKTRKQENKKTRKAKKTKPEQASLSMKKPAMKRRT
jgi:hypothetical protein